MYKSFSFLFPITQKVVRNLRIVHEHVGNLLVEGSASRFKNACKTDPLDEQYKVEIDFIKWEGTDIKPVLEVTELYQDIWEAAYQHASGLDYTGLTHREMLTVFANNLRSA